MSGLAATDGGDFVVVGTSTAVGSGAASQVRRMDGTGTLLWDRTFAG